MVYFVIIATIVVVFAVVMSPVFLPGYRDWFRSRLSHHVSRWLLHREAYRAFREAAAAAVHEALSDLVPADMQSWLRVGVSYHRWPRENFKLFVQWPSFEIDAPKAEIAWRVRGSFQKAMLEHGVVMPWADFHISRNALGDIFVGLRAWRMWLAKKAAAREIASTASRTPLVQAAASIKDDLPMELPVSLPERQAVSQPEVPDKPTPIRIPATSPRPRSGQAITGSSRATKPAAFHLFFEEGGEKVIVTDPRLKQAMWWLRKPGVWRCKPESEEWRRLSYEWQKIIRLATEIYGKKPLQLGEWNGIAKPFPVCLAEHGPKLRTEEGEGRHAIS